MLHRKECAVTVVVALAPARVSTVPRWSRVERVMSSNGRANGESRGRNGHVLVWEQSGLEEEDRPAHKRRSMPAENLSSRPSQISCYFASRYIVANLCTAVQIT